MNSHEGAHMNILGQLEPVTSPESLLMQHLDAWGGEIQLWDSDPVHREFVLSVVDRGNTLWYKLGLHGDNSCVINEVYYSELDQGLSAVAARHGIQRAEMEQQGTFSDGKKRRKSLKIWRRFSIGTFLKSETEEKKVSVQKSPKQVRRANSLRLFHPKVTRKFSLKNAHQDTSFRPAETAEVTDYHTQTHLNITQPLHQFVMPPPVQSPFDHATLPRAYKSHGPLASGSTGQLTQNTDLDSVLTNQMMRIEKRSRRKNKVSEADLEFELDYREHRKLTRSNSVDREGIQPSRSPNQQFGSCPKLSKYARSSGRAEKSPDLHGTLSRSGAHAYTSPQSDVIWKISLPTDQKPYRTQDICCPGDRPQPIVLDSSSAARFSVFPLESATLQSGTVVSSRGGRMPCEEAEAPRQILTTLSIRV